VLDGLGHEHVVSGRRRRSGHLRGLSGRDTVTVLDTSPSEGADVDLGTDAQTSGTDAAEDTASTLADVEADAVSSADVAVDVESPADIATPDAGADDVVDAGSVLEDSMAADTSVDDAGEPDPTDVALDDTSSDAAEDTAEPTPDVPQVFPSFSKTGCQKTVNLNTDGTVNPFISPARNGQFYVSWVQKGGNLMLTWESPTLCETVEGPFQVNAAEGTVYYWGGIAVVSDNQGNFYAVWESTQSGKDIAFAYSETGLTFSEPIELVSTSTNGQDPAIWVPKAGEVHAAWRGHHPVLPQYDTLYAKGTSMFAGGTFSTGLMVNEDDPQDDQVALVGDGKGKLYLAWQRFDGDLFASRSLDNGASWSAPVQVNDVNGMANVGKATFMTITPDGRVVIIWSDERKQKSGNENDVFADSSLDGLTWGVDVQVNDVDARYQEDPALAVATSGPCKGAVYAVWQDFRSKDSFDVYAARSTDGGLTWSANEAIANDLEGDEMKPAIAVGADCTIGVAWRDGVNNANFDIGTTYLNW
jgi:hypothetical protein